MKKFSGLLAGILATSALAGTACGGGDATVEEATPVRTEQVRQASPTVSPEPTPEATAAPAPGWTRRAAADFEIDLPENWETWDPSKETLEAVFQVVETKNPELAGTAQEFFESQPEGLGFAAIDTQSPAGFLRSLNVIKQELPGPTTIKAAISDSEDVLTDLGLSVVSTDTGLSIGGARAGRIVTEGDLGTGAFREAQYIILPEPTIAFILTFGTALDDFDGLEPTFRQIADSFRVTEGGG